MIPHVVHDTPETSLLRMNTSGAPEYQFLHSHGGGETGCGPILCGDLPTDGYNKC